jgi:DNA-directed RNA polymerase specialized sigma subunit
LSKTAERELIQKYRHNRTKLNKLLFMHNIEIVFNQAKKYMSKVEDFDALVQDGMIGLGEAA